MKVAIVILSLFALSGCGVVGLAVNTALIPVEAATWTVGKIF